MDGPEPDRAFIGVVPGRVFVIGYVQLPAGVVLFHIVFLAQPVDDDDGLFLVRHGDPRNLFCHKGSPANLCRMVYVFLLIGMLLQIMGLGNRAARGAGRTRWR